MRRSLGVIGRLGDHTLVVCWAIRGDAGDEARACSTHSTHDHSEKSAQPQWRVAAMCESLARASAATLA